MRSALLAVLLTCSAAAAPPYRFLLVAGSQWNDDASFLIARPSEFQITAALLKTWGLPFDIVRLDQQALDRYHLLDRDGHPRYGTVIWDAPDTSGRNPAMLAELNAQGASFIILGDTVKTAEVARLAGLRYVSPYRAADPARFDKNHFITRALEPELLSTAGSKIALESARAIAFRGAAPFITIRQDPGRGRVVWLDLARTTAQFQNQLVRDLLKRSLVWAQGSAVFPEYGRSLILFMDDWGASDKTYLPYWHYKTPTEEEIRTGLIEPLQKHHAVMDMNVNTGFVDRQTHRILSPWKQRVVDAIDGQTIHDYASTKRGLDAGLAAGVFSIESHGWTHMLPDLDSPPGPFWDAPMDGTGSLDWYNEFGDRLRKREIPTATQRFHMARAIEYLRQDFGVVPQILRPGGSLYSKSSANSTAVIAARMGFGILTADQIFYLGPDIALSLDPISRKKGWAYNQPISAADIPFTGDAPAWLGFHDRDLALDHSSVARLLDTLGSGIHYMNGAEYSAYLHAAVKEWGGPPGPPSRFTVDYDPHYCAWFATHPSRWTIQLSTGDTQTIEVPPGLGKHALAPAAPPHPSKAILVLAAHPTDAPRLAAPVAAAYRARGYEILYAAMTGPELDLPIDLTTATRRPQAQAAVSHFLQTHHPEIVITHAMGEASVVNHTVADLVYRAWQDARRKGARLGQLWFRVPEAPAPGLLSEPRFRRIFEPVRRGDYYAVADASSPAPVAPEPRPAPPPAYQPPPGRQPVVMGIAAHADDFEISFGATFAKLLSQGWKGVYVIVTNNTAGNQLDAYNPSHPGGYLNIQKITGPFPSDALETIQIRQEETRRAAAVFGVQPIFLNLNETFAWLGRRQIYMDDPRWALIQAPGNGVVTDGPENQGLEMATALMKQYQPDVVLTMLLGEENPEHGETADLAYRAFARAAREGAHVGQLWMALKGRQQYLERVRLDPDIGVDVTAQLPIAHKALAQHVSQNGGVPPIRQQQIGGKYYEQFVIAAERTGGPR